MIIKFRCLPKLAPILPEPIPAKRATPEWLKQMPMTSLIQELEHEVQTVKQCPPFIDAMTAGFLMLLPCDLKFSKGRFDWNWKEFPGVVAGHTARSPISFHHPNQLSSSPLFSPDRIAIKFTSFWTFEIEEGYSLLFTHPFNRFDLPFRAFTGIVDNDKFSGEYVHFPAAWVDDTFDGTLEKGTPIVQVMPLKREDLKFKMDIGVIDSKQNSQMNKSLEMLNKKDGYYKRIFRVKKP